MNCIGPLVIKTIVGLSLNRSFIVFNKDPKEMMWLRRKGD